MKDRKDRDTEKELQSAEEIQEDPGRQSDRDAAPEEETEVSREEQLQAELDALGDKHLRLMAEYDNYRKRSAREKEELYPTATAAAVEKFLPILDNLERAEQYERGTEEFSKGFEMICQSFRETLAGFEVEAIGQVGEPFDPELHNAVMHIEDESLGENVVSQVLQKGYRIGGKVIRYAMVQTAN